MEEMMCWSCKRSRTCINPKNIEEIDKNCELPSILQALELDENKIYCPHYSINEKVCNMNCSPVSGDELESLKDEYKDGKCPDCFEPITDGMTDGDKCSNCGHVFHFLENSKRIREQMIDEGYMQRQQGWNRGMSI
jgi:hypothetical protein